MNGTLITPLSDRFTLLRFPALVNVGLATCALRDDEKPRIPNCPYCLQGADDVAAALDDEDRAEALVALDWAPEPNDESAIEEQLARLRSTLNNVEALRTDARRRIEELSRPPLLSPSAEQRSAKRRRVDANVNDDDDDDDDNGGGDEDACEEAPQARVQETPAQLFARRSALHRAQTELEGLSAITLHERVRECEAQLERDSKDAQWQRALRRAIRCGIVGAYALPYDSSRRAPFCSNALPDAPVPRDDAEGGGSAPHLCHTICLYRQFLERKVYCVVCRACPGELRPGSHASMLIGGVRFAGTLSAVEWAQNRERAIVTLDATVANGVALQPFIELTSYGSEMFSVSARSMRDIERDSARSATNEAPPPITVGSWVHGVCDLELEEDGDFTDTLYVVAYVVGTNCTTSAGYPGVKAIIAQRGNETCFDDAIWTSVSYFDRAFRRGDAPPPIPSCFRSKIAHAKLRLLPDCIVQAKIASWLVGAQRDINTGVHARPPAPPALASRSLAVLHWAASIENSRGATIASIALKREGNNGGVGAEDDVRLRGSLPTHEFGAGEGGAPFDVSESRRIKLLYRVSHGDGLSVERQIEFARDSDNPLYYRGPSNSSARLITESRRIVVSLSEETLIEAESRDIVVVVAGAITGSVAPPPIARIARLVPPPTYFAPASAPSAVFTRVTAWSVVAQLAATSSDEGARETRRRVGAAASIVTLPRSRIVRTRVFTRCFTSFRSGLAREVPSDARALGYASHGARALCALVEELSDDGAAARTRRLVSFSLEAACGDGIWRRVATYTPSPLQVSGAHILPLLSRGTATEHRSLHSSALAATAAESIVRRAATALLWPHAALSRASSPPASWLEMCVRRDDIEGELARSLSVCPSAALLLAEKFVLAAAVYEDMLPESGVGGCLAAFAPELDQSALPSSSSAPRLVSFGRTMPEGQGALVRASSFAHARDIVIRVAILERYPDGVAPSLECLVATPPKQPMLYLAEYVVERSRILEACERRQPNRDGSADVFLLEAQHVSAARPFGSRATVAVIIRHTRARIEVAQVVHRCSENAISRVLMRLAQGTPLSVAEERTLLLDGAGSEPLDDAASAASSLSRIIDLTQDDNVPMHLCYKLRIYIEYNGDNRWSGATLSSKHAHLTHSSTANAFLMLDEIIGNIYPTVVCGDPLRTCTFFVVAMRVSDNNHIVDGAAKFAYDASLRTTRRVLGRRLGETRETVTASSASLRLDVQAGKLCIVDVALPLFKRSADISALYSRFIDACSFAIVFLFMRHGIPHAEEVALLPRGEFLPSSGHGEILRQILASAGSATPLCLQALRDECAPFDDSSPVDEWLSLCSISVVASLPSERWQRLVFVAARKDTTVRRREDGAIVIDTPLSLDVQNIVIAKDGTMALRHNTLANVLLDWMLETRVPALDDGDDGV